MMSSSTRRSPRQSSRSSLGGPTNQLFSPLPSRRGENAPIQPSPLRNEISSTSSMSTKSRKRARSLGGSAADDTTTKLPRKKRMTIAPARGILKKSMAGEDSEFMGGHTVIGVIQEALKEEKAKEEETETEIVRRRELRKSLNRRVSFASHATIRLFPQTNTPTQTPTPKKGVGFQLDGTPSTDNDSTGGYSPQSMGQHTPSPAELPRPMMSPASDSEETSMDIADDNLTLPLPSALIKRQLQRGVGFLVDDGDSDDDEEMDVTLSVGGIIIPSRDGVNRFLNGDDDQTMEFTQIYPSSSKRDEDDTVGMEFTKVFGKIQGLNSPRIDKENHPPVNDDNVTMDMTQAFGTILQSKNGTQTPYASKSDDDTQPMEMTLPFNSVQTPQQSISRTPESSPFYNSPLPPPVYQNDAEITRSPLSTGISGTPKRTPSKGLLALDLLTGTPLQPTSRRKSDSGILLGSPKAANRLRARRSIAGVEEFNATHSSRRVSLGREVWRQKEFGGDIQRTVEEGGIRDLIARMTPKKPTNTLMKVTPLRPTPKKLVEDEIMLTPGMMKREFGPKVASLVKVWEDQQNMEEEEDDFSPITLAEFLSMTNISFLDGLGPTTRRRTYAPPEGLSSLQKPELQDYAKAGAVSIPMLELYQFSCQNASKYISEGKAMIEGIEQDTLEDPPLLFREYVGAPVELKRIMDSQFKLVKTWARYKAKGGWYSWRDQLLGGVMPTLQKNADGLRKDKLRLKELREQLEPLFPTVKHQYEEVKRQLDTLRNQKEEIESADQDELRRVREEISIVSEGLEMRRAEMQVQEQEAKELLLEEEELKKLIGECRVKIGRAERIKELNRGFEKNEVESFKENLQCLKDISGWDVVRVDGSNIKMLYKDEINVSFNVDNLNRGAQVEIPAQSDVIQQFAYSALTPDLLKGDIRTILNRVSRIHHLSTLLRTELALIKAKHPITYIDQDACLIINISLLLSAARTKFLLTFTVPSQFFTGQAMSVVIERKYGEVDVNEVRRTVEGRVRSGGVGCIRGACEEVSEVWE